MSNERTFGESNGSSNVMADDGGADRKPESFAYDVDAEQSSDTFAFGDGLAPGIGELEDVRFVVSPRSAVVQRHGRRSGAVERDARVEHDGNC